MIFTKENYHVNGGMRSSKNDFDKENYHVKGEWYVEGPEMILTKEIYQVKGEWDEWSKYQLLQEKNTASIILIKRSL
jgi:hypothetical protein